jgi:hypothetical protein
MKWMEECPWQGNIQEALHVSWDPRVQQCVHKIMPLDSTLNQMNPVHILKPYFFKIHFSIILQSKPKSPI